MVDDGYSWRIMGDDHQHETTERAMMIILAKWTTNSIDGTWAFPNSRGWASSTYMTISATTVLWGTQRYSWELLALGSHRLLLELPNRITQPQAHLHLGLLGQPKDVDSGRDHTAARHAWRNASDGRAVLYVFPRCFVFWRNGHVKSLNIWYEPHPASLGPDVCPFLDTSFEIDQTGTSS